MTINFAKKIEQMKKETVINYLGTLLTITGEYIPAEKGVMYNTDMCGDRSYPSDFQISKVETKSGDDITRIFYDLQLEDMSELCLINLEE